MLKNKQKICIFLLLNNTSVFQFVAPYTLACTHAHIVIDSLIYNFAIELRPDRPTDRQLAIAVSRRFLHRGPCGCMCTYELRMLNESMTHFNSRSPLLPKPLQLHHAASACRCAAGCDGCTPDPGSAYGSIRNSRMTSARVSRLTAVTAVRCEKSGKS